MPTQLMLPVVVMIRHAQSEWNRQGRFTGWADPPLTDAGRDEAVRAGKALAEIGYRFDVIHTSRLERAQETAQIVMRHSDNTGVPVATDWRLNERHYGALQGEDKIAMAARVGEEQVWRWRRGYLDRPPRMLADDPEMPSRDPRWADIDATHLPNGESLAATRERVMDFWGEIITPQIIAGKRLMIASHGNTLRALIMALQDMSVAAIEDFEIPTGVPIVYAFSPKGEPIGWHYLNSDAAQAA
ncbi:MAG: 2,3-bisphosphoglycerate-dependent phosphoglycerate mutase [Gammaproteobacteria bacterium]|nr:2,3-bisphosphoglycerate-dependent phosphoglycerate mutase [Gammaproteobacteria bacterium]MCP5137728.1 2,3-bisphosphoglycerate-dependent phosphoglycerate mutase [Gammaproteobacteria bacterium]